MVAFTDNQLTAFFTNAPQMALSDAVRTGLAQEGLTTVGDFADFKSDQLGDAYKNMRTSIPGVPGIPEQRNADNVVTAEAVAAIAAIPPVLVSAKCALRLKIASLAYHYYTSIGRDLTPANMNYTLVLKDFYTEYEAAISLAKENKPDVPVLHKNNPPLKWIESFKDCLFRTYGIRKTPLLYVIRDNDTVPDEESDPLTARKAYGSSGSLLDELIARLDHTDPLFKSDNASVYSLLEEATRSTVFASTIKPFARRKDGRSAWQSMVSSHAGADKWEALQKEKSKFLMNTKWNGRTYSLEKFTGMHRSSFVQLEEAALHINFQLPTDHTRVGYLIDNINNPDPDLRADIANIRIDMNNMRSNFESAVAFLLPVDPYVKHKALQNKIPQIGDAHALRNKQQSNTGVDLRWHKPEEYKKLSKPQRIELYEWQRSKEGRPTTQKQKTSAGGKPKQSAKHKLQAKVAALTEKLKEAPKEPSLEELTACIAAANKTPSTPLPPLPPPPSNSHIAAAMALKSILKRKREE